MRPASSADRARVAAREGRRLRRASSRAPRVTLRGSAAASARRASKARLLALMQAGYHRFGRDRVGEDPARGSGGEEDRFAGFARKRLLAGAARAVDGAEGDALRPSAIGSVSHPSAERLFDRYRPVAARRVEPGPDFLGGAAAADRRPPRRPLDGRRSELGQLHEQAAAGPPRRSPDRLERADEAAGGRPARLRAGRGPGRRDRRSGTSISATARSSPREAFFAQIGADPSRKLDHADRRRRASCIRTTITCCAC